MLKSNFTCLLRNLRFQTKYLPRVISQSHHHYKQDYQKISNPNASIFFLASIPLWNILTGKDPEAQEKDEDKLITAIKRGVLSIKNGDYKTAEQILHVALKMAQDLSHSEAVTYIYDVLANLAMEAGDFKKSEKLFVDVMQRLFAEGHKEDSIKMLHISAKMAHICHFSEKLDQAMQGFEWTLEKLKEKLKKYDDADDLWELYGLTKNWYGQLLMDKNLYKLARENFEEAYKIYTKLHGEKTLEGVMILNNLSVACSEMDDVAGAIENLKKVLELAKEIPKLTEIGIFHANLGLLYLKQSLLNEATEACKLGYRLGHQMENKDAMKQASYCLDRIKKYQNGVMLFIFALCKRFVFIKILCPGQSSNSNPHFSLQQALQKTLPIFSINFQLSCKNAPYFPRDAML
uniref:CSON009544 protein n=1 Tax=Culicoides sonorensis TaxID=179676 RepID=A0A336LP89_CULSO